MEVDNKDKDECDLNRKKHGSKTVKRNHEEKKKPILKKRRGKIFKNKSVHSSSSDGSESEDSDFRKEPIPSPPTPPPAQSASENEDISPIISSPEQSRSKRLVYSIEETSGSGKSIFSSDTHLRLFRIYLFSV